MGSTRPRAAGRTFAVAAACVCMLALLSLPGATASAQTAPRAATGDRLFLALNGITGESAETNHVGDLVLQSFSWGMTTTADTSTPSDVKDVHIEMAVDKAMPLLLQDALSRTNIGTATLAIRNAIGQDYLQWTFGNVFLSGFQIDGATGEGKPLISFDMHFSSISVQYRTQLKNGGLSPAVKGGWTIGS